MDRRMKWTCMVYEQNLIMYGYIGMLATLTENNFIPSYEGNFGVSSSFSFIYCNLTIFSRDL